MFLQWFIYIFLFNSSDLKWCNLDLCSQINNTEIPVQKSMLIIFWHWRNANPNSKELLHKVKLAMTFASWKDTLFCNVERYVTEFGKVLPETHLKTSYPNSFFRNKTKIACLWVAKIKSPIKVPIVVVINIR